MFKNNEKFAETRRKREEVKEIASKKIEKLKDNSYFTNLLENRKKIKEMAEKRYKLEDELNKLKKAIEDIEQEEAYQISLQNWSNPITIDNFKHEYNENCYQKTNYDFFQLYAPIVEISICIKERTDLKVWKFEVISSIKNIKNRYKDVIKSDVTKFKTREEALTLVEKLKQELFSKYAEDFAEINKNITLANEVKIEFKDVERYYLPNELQWVLVKEFN